MNKTAHRCPIRAAIESAGLPALAAGLGVTRSAPLMWASRGRVPVEHRPGIEGLTGVRVERFGRDVKWVRIADPAWPLAAGRPLADFSRPAARRRTANGAQ